MIIKKCTIPLTLLKHQTLLRRLPPSHPKYQLIKDDTARLNAGYKGELALNFPLSFLDEKKYSILHDIRLFDGNYYFQIDCLLLTNACAIIVEVKNYVGHVYFDHISQQLIRTIDDKKEVFPNPILQAMRHEQQFRKWVATNRFPAIPVTSFVVFSNPHTLIESSDPDFFRKVIRTEFLPTKITQLEPNYQKELLNEKQIKKLLTLILKHDTPKDVKILEKYDLAKADLQKGVQCPGCLRTSMERKYGTWHCKVCNVDTKDAHILSMKDYAYLVGPTFTNRDMREFLNIPSPTVMTRLLMATNLPASGACKTKLYTLSTFY